VHVDHLHLSDLFNDGARGQARRVAPRQVLQRDLQTIGKETDEDVGFDARVGLMIHGADGEVALQLLERQLDLRQQHVLVPHLSGRLAREVAAQKIAPFAAAHFAQLLAIEVQEEGGAARALALVLLLAVNMDVHEASRAAGFLACGAELHHELVVRELHALQLLEPSPKFLETPPRIERSLRMRSALST
jgi:hypothetical protein